MNVVDDIKGRLDIVETVSGYVDLKKSGRYFKGTCPFHTERTPSFIVSPERQSWRCFGACATGGDVFSFVMRKEGLDFGSALRLLAQRVGISLSQPRDGEGDGALYRVNEIAAGLYQEVLQSPEGRQGMKYLEQRGVSPEVGSKFRLGQSPNEWGWLKSRLQDLGFTVEQAVQAGLVHRGEDGRTRDFFKGRLMFPIHDRQGRVVGFGARALDGSSPKYLNTPKTTIFEKRSILYGLHMAGDPIKTQNMGIIVEGYMDVIAAHQHSYVNVVASMGTALTEQQVSQLKPLCVNFVLALDPDVAGQEATLRSLESSWRVIGHQMAGGRHSSVGVLFRKEPLTLRIAALPAGSDPDKLIREDAKEWERLTHDAVPLLDYLIDVVPGRFDLSSGQGKAQAVDVLRPLIQSSDFFDQDRYVEKLATRLQVSAEALKLGFVRAGTGRAGSRQRGPEPQSAKISTSLLSGNPKDSLEDYTLALLLSRPELKEQARDFPPENFRKSEDREVFTQWLSYSTIDDLWDSLDETLHDHLTYLTHKDMAPVDHLSSEAALTQCLQRLELRHLQELQETLLASSGATAPPSRETEDAIVSVNARLRESFSQRAP